MAHPSVFSIFTRSLCNKTVKHSFYTLMNETESKESYSHILKYTGVFGGVQGLNILISLVRNKLVAILLGPGGMGLASLFNTAISFISQATNLGISFSAVRHLSEISDSGDEVRMRHFVKVVRSWTLVTALFGMLVCILMGPILSRCVFTWGDYTFHFIILSPVVAMLAITGGETAILKAARVLRTLAVIQIFLVFASLIISVPIYYFFGASGIIPVIVLTTGASMLVTVFYSYSLYPLRLDGLFGVLGEGISMVKLGVAFILAGILGSGVEVFIRSYLMKNGDIDIVGLYNAGYMLTITYAGMVFSAMETDYFPRLSAINHDVQAVNMAVNRQIEVSLLILSPMLIMLIFSLPILIPMLYSGRFVPVVGMAQVAVFSMYLKAVSLPISYITLAKGDSWAYLTLEAVSDVITVGLVVCGYDKFGLAGTGLALSLSYLFDLLIVGTYAYIRYHYFISFSVLKFAAIQFPLGLLAYAVTRIDNSWVYWPSGIALACVSAVVSIRILRTKTSLWDALKKKLLRHG